MPKEKQEEPFYVGISDPAELRRTILESSRDIVQHMQRAEKFKAVRKEKLIQIEKLKSLIKEITKNVNKLRVALPKTNLRAATGTVVKKVPIKEEKKVISEKPQKEEQKVERPKKPSTELEKLESELDEIESRLGSLS